MKSTHQTPNHMGQGWLFVIECCSCKVNILLSTETKVNLTFQDYFFYSQMHICFSKIPRVKMLLKSEVRALWRFQNILWTNNSQWQQHCKWQHCKVKYVNSVTANSKNVSMKYSYQPLIFQPEKLSTAHHQSRKTCINSFKCSCALLQ